jgi:cytochrome c biogenesis protein CcmG, thiol:disulfide interchange protein DsbE
LSDRRQWWFVLGTLALLGILVGVAWSYRDRFLPVEVGTRAPDFTATALGGGAVRLEQLRGQVVLLNIWATWCGPCRDEMPSLERLHQQLGARGLKIVAVSVDASPGLIDPDGRRGGDVAAFVRELGLTFTIWHDPEGGVQRTYRTTGVPETFLIGRDGVIRQKVIGATEWDDSSRVELIQRLLSEE